MVAETRVTEANQTQVPADIRARHHVGPGDIVVWEEDPSGEVRIRFRRKHTLKDLVGALGPGPRRDAVVDKKRAQRGEL